MRFQDCSLERPGAETVGVQEVYFPDLSEPYGTMTLVEPEDLGDVMGGKSCTLVVRGLSLKIAVSGDVMDTHAYNIMIIESLEARMDLKKIAETEAWDR